MGERDEVCKNPLDIGRLTHEETPGHTLAINHKPDGPSGLQSRLPPVYVPLAQDFQPRPGHMRALPCDHARPNQKHIIEGRRKLMSQMNQALTPGSVQDVAERNGATLAETIMNVVALILFDNSESMTGKDCPGHQERFSVAMRELRRLQAAIDGKIGVVQFNTWPTFIAGGLPDPPAGSTDVASALEYVQKIDGCGIRIILISDGEPDNAPLALEVAKRFTDTRIETVYIGAEGGSGAEFLRRLSALTGGVHVNQNVGEIPNLSATVTKLLTA